jgi:hypothetical protein
VRCFSTAFQSDPFSIDFGTYRLRHFSTSTKRKNHEVHTKKPERSLLCGEVQTELEAQTESAARDDFVPAAAGFGNQGLQMKPAPKSAVEEDQWACPQMPRAVSARELLQLLRKNGVAALWDWRFLPAHDRAAALDVLSARERIRSSDEPRG